MRHSARLASIAVLAGVLAACSGQATVSPAPSSSPVPSVAPSPSVPPSPSPSAPPPTPAPTSRPTPSPTPAGPQADAWSKIDWRKLAADDPLSLARQVVAFKGGYLALAEAMADGDPLRSILYVSTDGETWTKVPADAFGPTAVVVSLAPTKDGVAALALDATSDFCEDVAVLSCVNLAGPIKVFTSADGSTFTPHAGPTGTLQLEMDGLAGDHPFFERGVAPLLLVRSEDRWLGASDDGIAWDAVTVDGKGRQFVEGGAAAFGGGYVATGTTNGTVKLAHSTDGRTWTTARFPTACGLPRQLLAADEGLLVVGDESIDAGPSGVRWCSSTDGSSFVRVKDYAPLGASDAGDECDGVCPAGFVASDGSRLVAYRPFGGQAGWMSTDGVHWTELSFSGSAPSGTAAGSEPFTLSVLPFGIVGANADGVTWRGAAS